MNQLVYELSSMSELTASKKHPDDLLLTARSLYHPIGPRERCREWQCINATDAGMSYDNDNMADVLNKSRFHSYCTHSNYTDTF